jgi:nitrous oxidase accessory protein NosD
MRKSEIAAFVIILFSGLFCLSGIQSATSQSQAVISINQEGSVEPQISPVKRVGNTYYLMENTSQSIVINRNSIVFDGNGYTFSGDGKGTAINLLCTNIILRNTGIANWETAILSTYGNNTITPNYITTNYHGIITHSDSIIGNYIAGSHEAVQVDGSYNLIYQNQIQNNFYGLSYSINVTGNVVVENNFQNNKAAISTYTGLLQIQHNNFKDNSFPVQITPTQNLESSNSNIFWDNGAEGNYWSNYKNITQYIVHYGFPWIIDRYPLVKPVNISEIALPEHELLPISSGSANNTSNYSASKQTKISSASPIIDLTTLQIALTVALLALVSTAFFATRKDGYWESS